MQRFNFLFFIVFIMIEIVYSQLPYSFNQVAQINDGGIAQSVSIDNNGIVFLASGDSGLFAYDFTGSSFIRNAHVDIGKNANIVTIGPDRSVFLCSDSSLFAYNYISASFINTAKIDLNDVINNIAVSSNGTVFLSLGDNGLFAYSYKDSAFKEIANILGGIHISSFAVNSDSTIFVSFENNSIQELQELNFNGETFKYIAHIDSLNAESIKVSSTNIIFLEWINRIYSYVYDEQHYINTAYLQVGPEGAGPFISTKFSDISIGLDNVLFRAVWYADTGDKNIKKSGQINGSGDVGLSAYHYDGSSFVLTAYLDTLAWAPGLEKADIIVDPNGIIFVANVSEGLLAFTYSGYTGIDKKVSEIPGQFELLQNFPNPFNPNTIISYQLPIVTEVKLSIYNLSGQKVKTLVSQKQSAGNYQVEWKANGFASGLYFYRLETGAGFVQSRKLILLK